MDNNNNIRWAILGAGKIAHKFAQDFRAVKNASLVAVASSDLQRARQFAEQYGMAKAMSYDDPYRSPEIDAVYIATTHNFHFEQSLACLQHKKAVLCEKPITINHAQFKILAATAAEQNCFLMEAMWTYFLPALRKAKEWIDSGRIGNIISIYADFGIKMDFNPEGRLYNPALAGGALLDLGIYPIAISNYFLKERPLSIHASGTMSPTGVDNATSILLKFANSTALLFTSMIAQANNKAIIYGEEGYIEIPDFYKAFSATLFNPQREAIDTFNDERNTWGYNFETQEVTDCLLQNQVQSKIVSHLDTTLFQEIIEEVKHQIGLRYPME